MNVADWGLLALTCLAGAASPGPSLALLIRSVLRDGRIAGMVFGLAHGAGILLYAGSVAAGLGAALLIAPMLFTVLQAAGAIFLLWIAGQMIRAGLAATAGMESQDGGARKSLPLKTHGIDGFMIVFLNPKIAAFFLAIFSQFLDQGQSMATRAGMTALAWLIDTGWYLLIAVIIAFPPLLARLERHQQKIELGIGSMLMLIGLILGARMFMPH
ncbi:LysE family translocator [Alphaproteobacteria bacterium LSUCC0684]